MDKSELYEMLDIDTPEDFEYFENIATFFECDDYIEFDDVYELFKDVDKDTLAMLLNDYFEEISDFIPGESAEFFLMMDKIRLALVGLAKNAKDETVLANLAEELNRFRIWYSCDSEVICRNISDDIEEFHTLRDAIALARLEKLEHDKYTYDFSKCSDYALDEYVMSFGDVIAAAEKEDEEGGYIEEFMETFDNYGAYEEYDDYDEYNMYKEHDEEE